MAHTFLITHDCMSDKRDTIKQQHILHVLFRFNIINGFTTHNITREYVYDMRAYIYIYVTKMSLSNAKRLYYSNVKVQFNKRKTAAVAT